jgi:RNA polymerase sigma-70 factor (ECF subfamily)
MTARGARTQESIVHSPERPALRSIPGAATAAGLDFPALFAEHFGYVWQTLRRLGVPVRDLDDVTHDVFLKVYHQLSQYESPRAIKPWLFGFAFRVAADYRRLSRNRRELLEPGDEPRDTAPSAVERLVFAERLELALAALQGVELERRAVFILHELDECSIPEVAETLGINVNTAYSRLRLAREDFAKAAKRLRSRRGEP